MGIRGAFGLREKDGTGKQPAKVVVAAAMPLSGPGVRRIAKAKTSQTQEQWQREAWYYFDVIGQARGPMVWIANAVSQADVHATDVDPDTGKPTGPSEDAQAQAVANGVLGGVSQRSQLLRLVALCWQVPGEAWIIIRPQGRGKPDRWLVLSGNKVTAKGDSWQYTDPYNGDAVVLASATDRLIRLWCPHPDDQARADSSMRPALPICREIEKVSQNIAARLDSRIATNGVMALADEVDFPKGEHTSSAGAFMDFFMTAAEAGLQNPGQASSQVPIAFNAPAEFIANGGAFAHYDLSTAFDSSVVELRQDGFANLASTLDMPKSVAEQSQEESNHWSAWQVEESTYKIFIEPLLKAIGDAITEHWFRPALIALGWTPERADMVELGWDTTAIVARPDDTENLRDLHDRILISDDYMADENGVPEDARPSDEERTRRLLEKWIGNTSSLLADPAIAKAVGLNIEISPVAAGVDATVAPGGELEAPEPAPVNVRALPGTQGEEPSQVPDGLVAAAELIVYDALNRVGGRLLTNQNRGQFKSTPRHELHTVVPLPELTMPLLLEGSFEITDPVADAFGLDREHFRGYLRNYVTMRIRKREPYNRELLRACLADTRRASG